jgi:hypothetical protein
MIVRNRTWPIGQSPDERVRQRTLPVAGGDGATVSFDFVGMGGVLDSRWTFSRAAGSGFLAGTGPTYIGADGLVKYATTNQPRFDYDPTTRLPRGLLVEGSSTNLLQQSVDWTVSPWTKPAQITWDGTTYATAPDGTTSAKQVTVTGGSSASISQAATTGTNRTISLWIRAGSLTSFSVGAFDAAGTTWGNNADSTCRIISGPGNTPVQQVGGLWSITGLSTTQWTRVEIFRSTTYTNLLAYPGSSSGTINGTAYVWGMQMEAGNGASSFIPTGSATGTREQDTASFADAAAIGFDRRKGTLYFSGTQFKHASGFPRSVRLAAASGSSEPMGVAVSGSTFYGTARDASFVAFGDAIRTNTLLQPFAFAVAFNADTPSSVLRGSLNGSSVSVTQSSAAAPPTAAAVSIDLNSGSSATAYASMAIRSVKFWPTDKTLAELTSITS